MDREKKKNSRNQQQLQQQQQGPYATYAEHADHWQVASHHGVPLEQGQPGQVQGQQQGQGGAAGDSWV